MDNYNYDCQQNYCKLATNFQAVLSHDETAVQKPWLNNNYSDICNDRLNTSYSCPDNYQMGSLQDNHIFIATTDGQHNQLVNKEFVDRLSGYFSDQATVNACKSGESLDNTKYNEMCQIVPWRQGGASGEGDATYKPHVDCLDIDRNKLYENYGTYDFNAAIAKCEANNHLGSGGGNQGYNPYLSEMIENGTLKHNPNKSFSDVSLSNSSHNNPNQLVNSIIPADRADQIFADAQTRASDCVKNDTPHPSPEACNNGFPKNESPISSNTGHAVLYQNQQSNYGDTGINVKGTSPEEKQLIELPKDENASLVDPEKTLAANNGAGSLAPSGIM